MLIDDVTIEIIAGNGGDGKVSFQKNLLALGPTGGTGGKGGSVYMEGISNLSALSQFRFKKVLKAENGKHGRIQCNDGTDGADLIIKIPVGTVIHSLTTSDRAEITAIGERIPMARGGGGGKGNFLFRSSINTSPKQCERGREGERFTLRLELKLIADIGLIGLPNAGKSSMLNELTKARSKVANYPFTTLEPNLGVHGDLVLADIPGIIEGASVGKGLGVKFLRHIERTKTLFHFVSAESDNPARDYKTIRTELGAYHPKLLQKKEYLFLSKSDLLVPKEQKKRLTILKKLNPSACAISIHDPDQMDAMQKLLREMEQQKHI
ncbi:MAG: GTPase ObgE [Patescibacteria group bacterium]